MELIDYRKAPVGSKYIAEMDVYYDRIHYRKIRVMLSQKGNHFINIPCYAIDDGQGGKKWIPYWEFSKDEDILFKKHCLEVAKSQLHEKVETVYSPNSSGGYVRTAQTTYQPDLSGCPF